MGLRVYVCVWLAGCPMGEDLAGWRRQKTGDRRQETGGAAIPNSTTKYFKNMTMFTRFCTLYVP